MRASVNLRPALLLFYEDLSHLTVRSKHFIVLQSKSLLQLTILNVYDLILGGKMVSHLVDLAVELSDVCYNICHDLLAVVDIIRQQKQFVDLIKDGDILP